MEDALDAAGPTLESVTPAYIRSGESESESESTTEKETVGS